MPYSAFSAIAKQMANRFGANAISRLEVTASTPPDTRAFLRPRRSATMPLGTSHSRLTIWKTLSARPISHRENPRAASSATHTASVIRRPEKKSAVYTQPSCRLMLSVDCLFDFMESTFHFYKMKQCPSLESLCTTSPSPSVTPLLVGEALALRKLHLFPLRGSWLRSRLRG